jgi:hypothetical protein
MLLRRSKHYLVRADAGAVEPTPPVSGNPGRIGLLVQNTGGNLGLLRFNGPPLGDGSDIQLGAGDSFKWEHCETTPTESLNFFSTAGTTFAVLETVCGS